MQVDATDIPGVLVIEPVVHGDERGFFVETWQRQRYAEVGIDVDFVQDNVSRSRGGILRGLHYQIERPQGKLVRVTSGAVFDVAVDLRRWSPTFGRWTGTTLSAENHRQMFIPPGLAHGFLVLTETADFVYKCTDFYFPEHERALRWDDPDIGIAWPEIEGGGGPVLSERDRVAPGFGEIPVFESPDGGTRTE